MKTVSAFFDSYGCETGITSIFPIVLLQHGRGVHGQELCRGNDSGGAKRMQHEQVLVTRYENRGASGHRASQDMIVIRIA